MEYDDDEPPSQESSSTENNPAKKRSITPEQVPNTAKLAKVQENGEQTLKEKLSTQTPKQQNDPKKKDDHNRSRSSQRSHNGNRSRGGGRYSPKHYKSNR